MNFLKKLGLLSITACMTFAVMDFSPIADAEAKFRSSGSFSRSSFRSSSSRSSRPSFSSRSTNTRSTTNSSSTSSRPSTTTRSTTPAQPRRTFSSTPRQARQQSAQTRARFQKASTTTNTPRTTTQARTRYQSNPTYSRARGYDSGTYYSRRSAYYGTWSTPAYVYYGAPSYGMFDALFLYHILSTPHAGSMAYHYQNNSDYQTWRSEAEALAVENDELRTQLAAMDAAMASVTGPVQEGFVPEGVDADLMLAEEVRSSLVPDFRLCVAGASGTYANVATNIIGPGTVHANVSTVPTAGSREILSKIAANECDGGFVQGDSYWNYVEMNETTALPFERVLSPYKESVHLVCNTEVATVNGLVDLDENATVYFPSNSGAMETWINLVNENADYDAVGVEETSSYEAAIQAATNNSNACALYVGAAGSSELMRKTEAAAGNTKLELVEVVDNSLLRSTDPAGKVVYSTAALDNRTYPNLLRDGGCYGWCSGDVPTLQVSADFVVSNAWKSENTNAYDGFVLDLTGLQPQIEEAATGR